MGNTLYNAFFAQQNKTINADAFDYYKKAIDPEQKKIGVFEIETNDFSKTEEIVEKMSKITAAAAVIDKSYLNDETQSNIITAIDHYMNKNGNLYNNRAILAQTDYFVFRINYGNVIPLLSIKNTQAAANREKLKTYIGTAANNSNPCYFVASCHLSQLYNI